MSIVRHNLTRSSHSPLRVVTRANATSLPFLLAELETTSSHSIPCFLLLLRSIL